MQTHGPTVVYILTQMEMQARRQTELLTKVLDTMHAQKPAGNRQPWLTLSDMIKLVVAALILWSAFKGEMTVQDAVQLLK